jgi:hypothetical protein
MRQDCYYGSHDLRGGARLPRLHGIMHGTMYLGQCHERLLARRPLPDRLQEFWLFNLLGVD